MSLSRIDVEVTKESNPRLADRAFEVELTCVGRGPVIRAEAYADDKYAALDVAYGRLEERLRRAASRRHARHKKSGVLAMTPEGAAAALEVGSVAVAVRSRPVTLTWSTRTARSWSARRPTRASRCPPDALHAMELVGHDFFLFHDVDSGHATVVYKRRGYDYGLLRLGPPD